VAIAPKIPTGGVENTVSEVDSVSLWQLLFHIDSLGGSTIALVPCTRYHVSRALMILLPLAFFGVISVGLLRKLCRDSTVWCGVTEMCARIYRHFALRERC